MKLHLHEECAVRKEDIVGIFDMDNTSTSARTRLFLEKAEKMGTSALPWLVNHGHRA